MVRHTYRCFLESPLIVCIVVCCTVLTAPIDLNAQTPICFTDRLSYDSIPTFAKIQSAAVSGGSTLVVWGSAVLDASSRQIGQLYYQVVREQDSGSSRLLLDSTFRPSNFVAVIPLDAEFLIMWNDERVDRPGLYTQRVGFDGLLRGTPEHFHSSAIRQELPPRMIYSASAVTIFWTDAEQQHFLHRLLLNGQTVIDRQQIRGTSQDSVRRVAGLPDLIVMRVDGVDVTLDDRSRIQPLGVPSTALDGVHLLRSDSSLVYLRDSVVYMHRTLFDKTAIDSVVLHVPLTALALSSLVDSADIGLRLIYAQPASLGISFGTAIKFWRVALSPGLDTTAVPVASFVEYRTPGMFTISFSIASSTRTYYCDRTARIFYSFKYFEHSRVGSPNQNFGTQRVFMISDEGAVTDEPPSVHSSFEIDGHCDDTDQSVRLLFVTRLPDAVRKSRVAIGAMVLTAPAQRWLRRAQESEPNVFVERDTLRVAFRSTWDNGRFGVVDWKNPGATDASEIARINVPAGRTFSENHVRLPGTSIVERTVRWSRYEPPPFAGSVTSSEHTGYSGAGAWQALYSFGGYGFEANPPLTSYSQSQFGNEFAVCYGVGVSMKRPGATARWTVPVQYLDYWCHTVALDTGRVLLIGPQGANSVAALIVGPNVQASRFTISLSDSILATVPIGHDRYYMIAESRASGTLLVRQMNVNGAVIEVDSIVQLDGARDYFYFLDRSDTSLAILASDTNGLHIARSTNAKTHWTMLREEADVRHPAGMFHGDSLYLVWTKMHSNESDIYGVSMHRDSIPVPKVVVPIDIDIETPKDSGIVVVINNVWPTPASTSATFQFDVTHSGPITVTTFDTRGRAVRSFVVDAPTAGRHNIVVDVSEFVDGIYEVRATSNGDRAFARVAVVHDR